MKYRVREGKRFGKAGAGDIVEVEPHRAAIVPWCLELAGAPADAAAVIEATAEAAKPSKKKK